jgi:acyl carrier protein
MDDGGPKPADRRIDRILDILARETAVDRAKLTPEATIDGLGIPSLDMAQTLFALETHFDVEIPVVAERAGAEFLTVGDLVAHVIATVDAGPARPPGHAASGEAKTGGPEAGTMEAGTMEAGTFGTGAAA